MPRGRINRRTVGKTQLGGGRRIRKNIPRNINHLRKRNESIFKLPEAIAGPRKPKKVPVKVTGLKPNTKYKVMLDNYPGKSFEDITVHSKPVGPSVRFNQLMGAGPGRKKRRTYLKTDKRGELQFNCTPFGTDDAVVSGNTSTGSTRFGNLWKYWHTRESKSDQARDRIKLINYNKVNNPEAPDRVKTVKVNFDDDVVGTTTGPVTRPRPRPIKEYFPKGDFVDVSMPVPGTIDKKVEDDRQSEYYQTFYIDSATVDGSETVDLLDVVLYFRAKPGFKANVSGRRGPGVNVTLHECEADGTPIITERLVSSLVDLSYFQVKVDPLAQRGTVAKFDKPITVKTNRHYAIAIDMEDQGYVLWENKKGDLTVIDGKKTEERSQGSSKGHRGDVYFYSSDNSKKKKGTPQWQARNDLDLKFDVNIAEYEISNVAVDLVNEAYEFFNLNSSGQDWIPDEIVYKQTANVAGGVSIVGGTNKCVGTGTNFSTLLDGQKVVLIDSTDTTIKQVFTVDKSIAGSATVVYFEEDAEAPISGNAMLTVTGNMEYFDYYFNQMRLSDSSVTYTEYQSNTDLRFEVGDTIVGEESGETAVIDSYNPLPVNVFRADMNADIPPEFVPTTSYNFAQQSVSNSDVYALGTDDYQFLMNAPNYIRNYDGWIASASQEVAQSDSNLISNDSRSAQINVTYEYKGANNRSYSCPTLELDELDMILHRWRINNTTADEHLNVGSANTRHISNTLEMGPDGTAGAEDIRVILNTWRPIGTNVHVYAKIQNDDDPDEFEDKQWTKLGVVSGADSFSNKNNRFHYVEMEFGLSNFTAASETLDGTFTTEVGNNIIQGDSSVDLSGVSNTDVVRVYSPLFNDNYNLFPVISANNTSKQITLGSAISNNNIEGEGFKVDVQLASEAAFKNPDNYNVARYYNAAGVGFDTYNRVAIKLVLTAESSALVPKVDDYRVIGVTA